MTTININDFGGGDVGRPDLVCTASPGGAEEITAVEALLKGDRFFVALACEWDMGGFAIQHLDTEEYTQEQAANLLGFTICPICRGVGSCIGDGVDTSVPCHSGPYIR